jgi:hypothetical protein
MWTLILAVEPTLEDLINEAAQSKNWPMLAAAAVILIVPVVLKALGKSVPLLDQALAWAQKALPMLKKKAPPPAPEGEPQGVAKVVPIESAKKDEQP